MSRLALSFFGTFVVSLDRQPVTGVRAPCNQGLLVYLALQSERPVPREVLAALFWPEEPEDAARYHLRQALYQLRQATGDAPGRGEPHLIITHDTAQFNCDSDYTCDVHRFLAAVEAHDLDAAVETYTGELLPALTCDSAPFEDWLRQQREYLHRLALEAMFELAQEHLQAGRLQAAQTLARRQLGYELWRERAWRQLMQALALAGEPAQALLAFEKCRQQLRSELQLEPSTATATLAADIRAGRYGRAQAEAVIPPPPPARHNLPADITPFIGRELELRKIVEALTVQGQRLLTITGPGGSGKSRLALTVARALLPHYDDGAYLVELAAVADPAKMPAALATSLGYQLSQGKRDAKQQVLALLGRRRLLLVLDNFEHLVAGAPLLTEILEAAPQVTLLVTSRQCLNLFGEMRYDLQGLDYPPGKIDGDALDYTAVRLFLDSGQRRFGGFALTADNADDVAEICRLVQGMPLALILAAAWLELLAPAEIAAEIRQGLAILAADLQDLPPRQRSMEAAFARSWHTMTGEEQAVLTRLTIFRGGFTREAAEVVAGANLRLLLSLVNKSLIQRDPENGRFAMHELLRQFAAARRSAAVEEEVAHAHCRYFAGLLGEEPPLRAPHVASEYAADWPNIQQAWQYAVDHGLGQALAQMASAIISFSGVRGVKERSTLEQAMAALRQRGVPEHNPAMLNLRAHVRMLDAPEADEQSLRDALKELVAAHGGATTHYAVALLLNLPEHVPRPDGPEADEQPVPDTLSDLIALYGDPPLRCATALYRAEYLTYLGDPEALSAAAEAVRAARDSGSRRLIKFAEAEAVALRLTVYPEDAHAARRLQAMLRVFDARDLRSSTGWRALLALSVHYEAAGDWQQALAFAARCREVALSWHDLYWMSKAADQFQDIYAKMGRPDRVGRSFLQVLNWHLASGQEWQTIGYLYNVNLVFPQLPLAKESQVAILSMVYNHPDAMNTYKYDIAAALPGYEAAMGSEACAAAWERGKALTFDEAVALVRGALSSSATGYEA